MSLQCYDTVFHLSVAFETIPILILTINKMQATNLHKTEAIPAIIMSAPQSDNIGRVIECRAKISDNI
jgi:hypothetical protein